MTSPAVQGHGEEHPGQAVHHGPSVTAYYVVFGGLIGLTLLTTAAAYAPMPAAWHTPVALLIAAAKATLVLMVFMHLWYSPRLIWLIAFGSLLWLAIMLALTFADYLTRNWMVT
jgi:cytochrome c oxidase subunit 4